MAAFLAGVLQVNGSDGDGPKPAIVLAAFGTTEVGAVDSILNIKRRVQAAFPGYDVHLAFTSNIIRGIWRERANDADFQRANPGIPAEIYCVRSAMATLGLLQDTGRRPILVQSLHVTDGEEYTDLENLVNTLANYDTMKPRLKPFPRIGIGQPALGLEDGGEANLNRAAAALEPLWREAQARGAALVLMAHGNEHLNQNVFAKLESVLRHKFGNTVYIGTVEAEPLGEDVVRAVRATPNAPKKVLLAPLMVVAGDHAVNDMAGEDDDSWLNLFQAAGFDVETHLVGLGSNDSWADIYVEHLKELEQQVMARAGQDAAE
ncbi:MAG: sirohydrochlorin cobaltochelatase [Planctomycetaceae bacterium]|nr:sirohydrochlorin cobaltochelatase [Planctomycetaceae bacterium]